MKALTSRQQVTALECELRMLLNRFAYEFDITIGEAIGTLETVKLELYARHRDQQLRQQGDGFTT